MYSHTQIIDDLIEELLRPDLRAAMGNALNQTIRELHFTTGQNPVPVGYADNIVELEITADSETGFTYVLPRPRQFQMMEAVWYSAYGRYATQRRPSSIRQFAESMDGAEYGWYRSGDTIAFDNYGGLDADIQLAWFEYVPRLKDYEVEADAPAWWDDTTESWAYHEDYDTNAETRANALALSTSWMHLRWKDTLMAGVRAKIWARLGDTERAKIAYSSYESLRPLIVGAETYNMTPRYRS